MQRTSLSFDLQANIIVKTKDDQVRSDVENAHSHQNLGVVEGDSFRDLHHPEDDHQVGAENSQLRERHGGKGKDCTFGG